MSPKVSIIIPVYNGEQYVGRCVRSVLSQNVREIECICIDDGSTDRSGTILDAYVEKVEKLGGGEQRRLKVLHQPNRGVSAARNAGLDAATGDYVVFVDSDDALKPDFLDGALPCLEDDPELDAWIGQRIVVDMDLEPIAQQPKAIPAMSVADPINRFLRQDGRYYLYCVWGKVFRRSVIEKNRLRFNPGVSMGEDALFAAEYYSACRKVMVDDRGAGYLHSQRSGSLVRRSWVDVLPDYVTSLRELVAFGHERHVEGRINPLAAQWALGRFSVMFHPGYDNLWMRRYIVALCRHPEFKTTILGTIVRYGDGKYAAVARVMSWLPRRLLIETLFLAVCLSNFLKGR